MKKILFCFLAAISCYLPFCHAAGKAAAKDRELLPKSAEKLYPKPRFLPPSRHPRVLARPEDIDRMRRDFKAPENAVSAAMLKRLAASLKSGKLDPARDRHRFGVFNERTLAAIRCNAYLYLLYGDIATGEKAITALKEFLETYQLNMRGTVTRNRGDLIYTMALVYDWCYFLLKPEDRKLFIARTEEIASKMEIGCPPVKQKGNITGHAGEEQLLRDLMAFGIAAYDEKPTLYLVCAGRFFSQMERARNFFYPSGRHHQGCMYGPFRFQCDLYAGHLFRRMGLREVYTPEIINMKNGFLYSRLPDGSFIPDGDHFLPRGRFMTNTEMLLLFYSFTGDPEVKAEFYRNRGEIFKRTSPLEFLLYNRTEIKPKEDPDRPLSCFFPDPLGGMIARSGWGMGKNADTAVVYMQGAGIRFGNHQHADAGSFQIYYKGALATDPGQYLGYGTPYDWTFTKGSASHNLLLIYDEKEQGHRFTGNDGGQRRAGGLMEPETLDILLGGKYDSGKTLAGDFGPNRQLPLFSYLKSDLAVAYGPKVKRYARSMVFVNAPLENAKGALVVYDDVETAKPEHRKIFITHTLMKPEWKSDRGRFEVENTLNFCSGRLECVPLLPEKFKVNVAPSVEFFGRTVEPPIPQDDTGKSSKLEIMPEAQSSRDRFLTVFLFGDAGTSFTLQPKRSADGEFFAADLGKFKVFFPAEPAGVKASSFTIKADADGQNMILTGLDGTYEISGVGAFKVAPERGTLFFVAAKAGAYTVKKVPSSRLPAPDYSSLRSTPGKGTEGIIVNGKPVENTPPLRFDNNVLIAPASVLADAVGGKFKESGRELILEYAGGKLTFSSTSSRMRIDEFDCALPRAPQKIDGVWYLPVDATAKLLGLSVYTEENLLFLKLDKQAERPGEVPVLAAAGVRNQLLSLREDGLFLPRYWGAEGKDAVLTLYLGGERTVSGCKIVWHLGRDRENSFDLSFSSNGKYFEPFYSGKSEKNDLPQTYRFDKPVKARFIRLTGKGNSLNNWTSITSIVLLP